MTDFEKLHAEILALEEKVKREKQKALDEIEKKYCKERDKKRKELDSKCNHEFVVEARHLNKDYHAQCGCFRQPDPLRHSKAYFRACCVCHTGESSPLKGVFSKLTAEPIGRYYDSLAFDAAVYRFSSLPLPELRAEAERLRKKDGE